MDNNGKKHPCPDCSFCQWCGDDRCRLCRNGGCSRRKLSLREQIELYEAINSREGEKKEGSGSAG